MTRETILQEIREHQISEYFELKIGQSNMPVIIEADHAIGSIGIKDIVRQVSDKLGATSLVATKPRSEIDVARRESKPARLGMRWAFDKVMERLVWLDDKNKLVKDIHRVCLNGIENRNTYDVVIATNHSPANEDNLVKMQKLLKEKMEGKYNVILSTPTGKGSKNGGLSSISDFRRDEVYGEKFQTYQIGVSKRVRENDRQLFIDALVYVMVEIQK